MAALCEYHILWQHCANSGALRPSKVNISFLPTLSVTSGLCYNWKAYTTCPHKLPGFECSSFYNEIGHGSYEQCGGLFNNMHYLDYLVIIIGQIFYRVFLCSATLYKISMHFTSILLGSRTCSFQYQLSSLGSLQPCCHHGPALVTIQTHKQSLSNQVPIYSWVESVHTYR